MSDMDNRADNTPFGTRPGLSRVPVVLLAVAYGVWTMLLLLMAIQRVGGR